MDADVPIFVFLSSVLEYREIPEFSNLQGKELFIEKSGSSRNQGEGTGFE